MSKCNITMDTHRRSQNTSCFKCTACNMIQRVLHTLWVKVVTVVRGLARGVCVCVV